MFYSMVDKCYDDSVAEVFNILATSRSCINIHCSYQQYHPPKTTFQVSLPMIEYLVAMSYELWIM